MKSLVQRLKMFQMSEDKAVVYMVAALAACVISFSIIWLHTWYG